MVEAGPNGEPVTADVAASPRRWTCRSLRRSICPSPYRPTCRSPCRSSCPSRRRSSCPSRLPSTCPARRRAEGRPAEDGHPAEDRAADDRSARAGTDPRSAEAGRHTCPGIRPTGAPSGAGRTAHAGAGITGAARAARGSTSAVACIAPAASDACAAAAATPAEHRRDSRGYPPAVLGRSRVRRRLAPSEVALPQPFRPPPGSAARRPRVRIRRG